jgi:hypothetical protein
LGLGDAIIGSSREHHATESGVYETLRWLCLDTSTRLDIELPVSLLYLEELRRLKSDSAEMSPLPKTVSYTVNRKVRQVPAAGQGHSRQQVMGASNGGPGVERSGEGTVDSM